MAAPSGPGTGLPLAGSIPSQQGQAAIPRLSPEQQQHLQRIVASQPGIWSAQAAPSGPLQAHMAAQQSQHGGLTSQAGAANPPMRPMLPPQAPGNSAAPRPATPRPAGNVPASRPPAGHMPHARPPQHAMRPIQRGAEVHAAQKRLKKRARPDSHVPDQLADSLGDSAFMHMLRKAEQRVDAAISRKHADVYECMRNPQRATKRLRLFVSNTHAHQPGSSRIEGSSPEPPSWVLSIQPKLLDLAQAEGLMQSPPQPAMPPSHNPPGLSFIRKVQVRLLGDAAAGTPDIVREWDRAEHSGAYQQALQIRQQGTKEVQAQITVHFEHDPPRFAVAPPLAQLIGSIEANRHDILATIFAHISANDLLKDAEQGVVRLDAALSEAFGLQEGQVRLSSFSQRITPLLTPLQPLTFPYTIRVTGASPTQADTYDTDVSVLQGVHDRAHILADNPSCNLDAKLEAVNDQLSQLVASAKEHKRRHAILMGFAHSPVDLINGLLAAQTRELRTASGAQNGAGPTQVPKAMRKSEHYRGAWVEDAVLRHLHRQLQS